MNASRIFGYLALLVLLASARLFGADDGLTVDLTASSAVGNGSYQGDPSLGTPSVIYTNELGRSISLPSSTGIGMGNWDGSPEIFTVTATNVVSYTITLTPRPQYELYINGICRNSITLPGCQDANGNPVSGTITDQLAFTLVRKWRGPSAYAVSSVNQAPLGSSGSIQYELPFNDLSSDAQLANGPRLEFNLGLAKNGVPLPPLKVALDSRNVYYDTPDYPDMPEVSCALQSDGTTWITAPQVTAIFALQNSQDDLMSDGSYMWWGNGNYSISFAQPGHESTPFVTYVFSSDNWNNSATVTKSMPGVARTYETTVYFSMEGTTATWPGLYSCWSFDDWHDSGQPVQRHVGMSLGSDVDWILGNYAVLNVTDSAGNLATSTRIDYKTYIEMVSDSISSDGSYYYPVLAFWWVPIKKTEGNGGPCPYPTQYYTNEFWASQQVGETFPGGASALSKLDESSLLPVFTCKSWLNNIPTGTDLMDNYWTFEQIGISINQNGGTITNYGYTTDWGGLPDLLASSVTTVGSNLLEQTTSTYQFADNMVANGQPILVKTTSAFTDANNSLVTVAKTYRTDTPDVVLSDLPYSVQNPDGTQTDYAYEHGTYDAASQSFTVSADDTSPDLRITTLKGLVSGGTTVTSLPSGGGSVQIDAIGLVANRSTETADIFQDGLLVRRETWICTGASSFEQLDWEDFTYTPDGRLVSHVFSNGTSTTAVWDGDRKTSETDETGLTTTYLYDSMSRATSMTRQAAGNLPALCTQYTYDADSRVLSTTVGGQLTTTNAYDTGGRLISKISAAGIVTQYAYANGGQTMTETLAPGTADEASKTTTYYADGRVQNITGTAVINEYHTYDFDANGRPRETINYDTPAGRSKVIIRDLLGRVVETDTPGYGSDSSQLNGNAPLMVTYNLYNAKGQPYDTYTVLRSPDGTEQPISAHQLTEYDDFGAVSAAGLDIDNNGTLSATSSDRFVSSTNTFSKDGSGLWWEVTTTQSYTDNQGDYNQAQTRTQVSGLSTDLLSKTVAYDYYGNATTETTAIDSNYASVVDTVTLPDGSSATKSSVGGFRLSEQSADAGGNILHATAHTYDAQGRQTGVTDSRTGTTTPAYYSNSNLVYTVTAATGAIVATNVYDNAGRISSVTDANGHTIVSNYNPRGQLIQQSGSGTYPVQYDYDDYGQKIALRTYRNGIGSTADQTTFAYDVNTGWLMSKTDATGQQVTFSYNYDFADGYKQTTRTWARGVTTTSNLSLFTGDLISVSYSDGTPSVSYHYTRDGHADTVTDATGTRDFFYNKGQLMSEALPAWFNGLVITHNYETATTSTTVAGRYAGFYLGYATNGGADLNKEMAVAYSYDDAGRLSNLTANYKAQGSSRPALSVPFAYHYLNQSSLWDQVNQGTFALKRQFEPARDVLTDISNSWNGYSLAHYQYVTNAAGQCEAQVQDGTAFVDYGDATGFAFGYDSYGQLTTATGFMGSNPSAAIQQLPGRDLSYNYDTAGNRTTVGVDSESVTYTANNLNQVSNRGTLKTRVSGTADPNATVSVGSVTASRQGRYWDAVAFGNSAQNAQVNVSAVLGSQSQSASWWALQRPAQESPNYDLDGNLTADSAWTYTWDAENRLVHMATSSSALGAPNSSETIDFTYDYLDRRVRKVVTLNGSVVSDHKYIYQGWLLIAEVDATTNQVVRSYAWGLDQSGSLDGGGGVGGLLMETMHTSTALTTYDVAHDGDDNVTTLVNTASGAFGAIYEYDPFGQLLRSEGSEAANNPFQFSTKYRDHETGLIYYGYRYYDPSLARFINRDPKEEAGGLNLYGFVANDPLWHWDDLGLAAGTGITNSPSEDGPNTEAPPTAPAMSDSERELQQNYAAASSRNRLGVNFVDMAKETSVSSHDTPNGTITDSYSGKTTGNHDDHLPTGQETGAIDSSSNAPTPLPNSLAQTCPVKIDPNNAGTLNYAPPGSATAKTSTLPGASPLTVSLDPARTVEQIDAGRYQILTDGTNVLIRVRMKYIGEAATLEVIAKFDKGIDAGWTGQFGKYRVQTFAIPVSDDPAFHPLIVAGEGQSGESGPNGIWFAGEDGWVAAHEIGHAFGLPDRYAMFTPGQPALPHYEHNIMAVTGGVPYEQDITDILTMARARQNESPSQRQ